MPKQVMFRDPRYNSWESDNGYSDNDSDSEAESLSERLDRGGHNEESLVLNVSLLVNDNNQEMELSIPDETDSELDTNNFKSEEVLPSLLKNIAREESETIAPRVNKTATMILKGLLHVEAPQGYPIHGAILDDLGEYILGDESLYFQSSY